MAYNFLEIEKKWQKYWDENKTYYCDTHDFSKPKFYVLDMFPYPSGAGLHVGHPEGYTASDILCRMKRLQGYNVLHPMGWDAFGLPAEQYAINTGNHPEGFTLENIANFKRQIKMLGFSYDWDKEISTADPAFYKWTQWIFKNLYEDGLAVNKDMPVNWCEELGTVLANDEVIDGKSERGGFPVVRVNRKQWVLRITEYAEKLLEGLDTLNWPSSTKEIQRNWIGKSKGANIKFVVDEKHYFNVYTTRPDTLFGATYCVLAPEHPLVDEITTSEYKKQVQEYKDRCASKSELERGELNKDKTGVFTGAYAINPANNKLIPVWIGDYVLFGYGEGAVMACPGHDERDYAFAKKYDLPIIEVLEGGDISKEAFVGDGKHVNSEFLNGLYIEEAKEKMIEYLSSISLGEAKVQYKLRDWIFARQRYWGEPIPVVHYDDHDEVLPDEALPLVLPELDDYKPKVNGKPPLENNMDWVRFNGGLRETNTMPGSAGSSWYYLRYIDPKNDKELASKELLNHWMPVDLYIGGAEHAVGHLLYSRFWNRYLYEKGITTTKEPFARLFHQGMILGENGLKMSKSLGNVVNPDDVCALYGADSLRLYEMFMGPLEASLPWSTKGLEGAKRFIERVYRLFDEEEYTSKITDTNDGSLDYIYHTTVKKVTNDFEALAFNTAISQMMIFVNELYKANKIYKEYLLGFLKMFFCICPHAGEELYNLLGYEGIIDYTSWPTYDEAKTVLSEKEIGVQVNGKLRGTIKVKLDSTDEEIQEAALTVESVKRHLEGKTIRKIIVIKNRIVNIVVS